MIPGKIELAQAVIVLVCVIAVITDLWRGRIYNWLTLPAILLGFLLAGFQDGWTGIGGAFLGALLGLLLYGWMFFLGFMGGGDVKLLMALGALGGFRYCAEVALVGVILGGAMAVILLSFRGKLFEFFRKSYRFIVSVFIKELEIEVPKIDRKLTMPYGLPIAVAAIWTAFGDPLGRMGLRLWN